MRYLLVLIASFVIYSCRPPKTECTNYSYYYLFFERSSNDSITDTAVWFGAYEKESKFTALRDSVRYVHWGNGPFRDRNAKEIDLPLKYASDSFDWKFICYPSLRIFTIKNFSNHQRSMQQIKYQDHECSNDLTFLFNDSMYFIPGGNGPLTAFLELKYD